MKKNLFILFCVFSFFVNAQTDLVRWGLTSNGNVTYSSSRINASSITTSQNPISYDSQGMNTTGWNNGNIEHYRFFGFSLGSSNGSSVKLSNLAFEQERLNNGPQNYTIKYYVAPNANNIDDYTFFYNTPTKVLINNESITSNPVKNIPLNITLTGTQTLIVKFYASGNDYGAAWRIKANTLKVTEIQDIPTAPIANNDTFNVPKNNDGVFNILSNDVSSSAITTLSIAQQPTHGAITVNGITDVTYKPTIGFTGTDTFKYTSTNSVGTSNIATVTINVVDNTDAALVRWNNSNFVPTSANTHLTVGNITSTQNLSFVQNLAIGSGYNAFETSGWPDKNVQTIDTSKYIQFTVSPKNGYKLNLSEFNLLCMMQSGDGKIKIDYSLNSNFSNAQNLLPETNLGNSITTFSLKNFSKPIATDGQVLYLRIYVYNTWNAMHILLKNGQDVGPAFIGNVEYSSTVPIAYNDTVTNIINNDTDINVLVNDDYSNKITTLTYTQPSHGTAMIKADKSINYIPAKDYVGADSFTYYITNEYGVSNVATVNISNVLNSTSPLVRWDKTTFGATSFQSFLNPLTITATNGIGIAVGGETNPRTYYVEASGDNNAFNSSKYIQFVMENNSTMKTVEPKTFSYVGKGTASKYEIRYSKTPDFSSDVVVLSTGTLPADYSFQSFNFDAGLKLEPGEKIYLRMYFFNTYYVQFIMQFITGGTGPEIDGLFYNTVYSPKNTIWLNSESPHWSNGTPTATKSAVIETNYNTSTNSNFESNNLTINAGGSLNITNEGYIKVNGQIVNNAGTANFVVDDKSNILQNGNAQNVGNATIKKGALIPKMGYNYWSSPVIGQNLYQFSDGYNTTGATGLETGTPWNRFYVYNEANDKFVNSLANDITLSATSVFQPARGYAIRGKNSFPLQISNTTTPSQFEFKGIPQNGDVSFTLKYTNAAHGYNMVGNPYPSNISFDDFFEINKTKINGVLFLWTNNDSQVTTQQGSTYVSNNYALYNGTGGTSATYLGYNNRKPNGYISLGQGFIVQVKAAGKDQALVFNNSMRRAEKANFYNKGGDNKSDQKNRFWIEFKSPTNVNNEILIGYIPTATNEYDPNFDTELLAVGNDSFWSVLDNKKLGIQARQASFSNEDVVKLGIKASVSGNYTIGITDKEGIFNADQDVLLKDSYTNKVTNLKEQPYVFTTNPGQYEDRFQIIYRSSATLGTDNSVKNGIQIYKDLQNFIVNSPDNLDEVNVYDALGRLIFSSKNSKKEVLINKTNFAEGLYIIKARSGNTTVTKKVLK